MIKISESAADFIHHSSVVNKSDFGLRVAVYPDSENSCFNYGLGFDEQKDSDEIFDVDGIKLIIDKQQTEYLENASIDYVKLDDDKMNLIVINPNDPSHVSPKKDK